jgi:hypothetical protein
MPVTKINRTLFVLLTFIACFVAIPVYAHSINYALENAPVKNVIWFYLKLGFEHIVPLGVDHILFVVCLCLLNNKFKTVLWQATAFTVAHSITLALSMQNIIVLPAEIVEPIIALSIFFVAVENLLLDKLKPWRIILVFIFGLIHGVGFASVLSQIGLPRDKFLTSILSFNLGVEIGQIAVISVLFALIILPFGKKPWYRKFIVYPLSVLIACIALYWTVQRVM